MDVDIDSDQTTLDTLTLVFIAGLWAYALKSWLDAYCFEEVVMFVLFMESPISFPWVVNCPCMSWLGLCGLVVFALSVDMDK